MLYTKNWTGNNITQETKPKHVTRNYISTPLANFNQSTLKTRQARAEMSHVTSYTALDMPRCIASVYIYIISPLQIVTDDPLEVVTPLRLSSRAARGLSAASLSLSLFLALYETFV